MTTTYPHNPSNPSDSPAAEADPDGRVKAPRAGFRRRLRHAPSRLDVRQALLGVLAAICAGIACTPAWLDAWSMVRVLGDNGYVLVAPLVIGFLAWRRRPRLAHVRIGGRGAGPVLIVTGWLVSHAGFALDLRAVSHLGALAAAVGGFVGVCGLRAVWQFGPVFAATLFLLPVPGTLRELLVYPLEFVTIRLAVPAYELLGGDAYLWRAEGEAAAESGGLVVLVRGAGGEWSPLGMHPTFNGVPMALGLVVVVYAFAFGWPLRNRYRWSLLLLAAPVALAANVLRALPIMFCAARRGPGWREAEAFVAAWGAWLALPLAFVSLLLVYRLMRWAGLRVERYRLAG